MKKFLATLLVAAFSLVGTAHARYVQADPIGLDGGWNRFGYVDAQPLGATDPQGLSPNRTNAQPMPVPHSTYYSTVQVVNLISSIRRYDSSFNYQSIRPAGGFTRADVTTLTTLLRSYESHQACPRDGVGIGRFIADQRGNVMIEPLGGSTVSWGRAGADTHTLHPNQSNYMRLNPAGHGALSTPHGHAHLPGTGAGRSGQGPSVDVHGNIVPSNSPAAHWPIN